MITYMSSFKLLLYRSNKCMYMNPQLNYLQKYIFVPVYCMLFYTQLYRYLYISLSLMLYLKTFGLPSSNTCLVHDLKVSCLVALVRWRQSHGSSMNYYYLVGLIVLIYYIYIYIYMYVCVCIRD